MKNPKDRTTRCKYPGNISALPAYLFDKEKIFIPILKVDTSLKNAFTKLYFHINRCFDTHPRE